MCYLVSSYIGLVELKNIEAISPLCSVSKRERDTDRETDRQTDRLTDGLTDKQTDRKSNREKERQRKGRRGRSFL